MKKALHSSARLIFFLALLLTLPSAAFAQVTVIMSGGFAVAYKELLPEFERTSGIKVTTTSGASMGDGPNTIPNQIRRGVPADIVILSREGLADLIEERRTVAGTDMDLARSLQGMVVRAGAPRPDISSVEAFKRTLLDAASIAYSDSGSGTYLSTTLFAKLGVANQVEGKSRKVRGPPSGEPVAAVVARGEVEIGFQQVSELIHVPGVTYVGPIPAALQPGSSFAGAITSQARELDAARALLRFLASPQADATIVESGLTPIPRR